jgi:hypothetical protein
MENYIYLSPQQIATSDRYPLTLGQVRHFLLFRHRNGLEPAVRKVGKRLMLRSDLFNQWIENQSEEKNG